MFENKIEKIIIEKVKGINKMEFPIDIYPNKPTILVAPNGTGKSSFASAFESLNNNRINLHKDHAHVGNESYEPKIELHFIENGKKQVLSAGANKNNIKDSFDVFVINGTLIPKTKQQTFNERTYSTSTIEVPEIILISKIPEKHILNYKYKYFQERFKTGQILPNLTNHLHSNNIERFGKIDFKKLTLKTFLKQLEPFSACISGINSKLEDKKIEIEKKLENITFNTIELESLMSVFSTERKFDQFFLAIQTIELFQLDEKNFKRCIQYSVYENEKNDFIELFNSVEKTWKNISPKEDKKKGLIIQFPKANQISNGERDFLVLLANINSIRRKVTRKNCIIIIDEVFDYLDDCNLIVAQYYLSRLIKDIENITNIYPIILTHLNPYYFKNYRFSKQQVRFIKQIKNNVNQKIKDIILVRKSLPKDSSLLKKLDKYYFHYSSNFSGQDFQNEFKENSLPDFFDSPIKFRKTVFESLQNYVKDKSYCPLSVCCAVRIAIEEIVCNQLEDQDRKIFEDLKMTDPKLDFAREKNVTFSETYNLLGVIYNEALHLDTKIDKITPIIYKLQNLIIKKMIQEVFSDFENQS